MSYTKKISQALPALIILLLDDSGSQADCMPGTNDAKFIWVERYVGHVFKQLMALSTDMQNDIATIKPRYYVSTILYGTAPQLWGDEVMDIQAVLEKYGAAKNSLGLGGNLHGTDTAAAFAFALDILQRTITQERFRHSFPPLVFHLTDGESQTDAESTVNQIKQLATEDGNVLVVNAYIGTRTSLSYKGPEDFPGYLHESEAGPNEENTRLFRMSSETPECIRQNLLGDGTFSNFRAGSRLFFDVRTKEMLKNVIQVVGSIDSRADRTNR